MDYPFPLIKIDDSGALDLSDAYDTGIGEWDKRAILYAIRIFLMVRMLTKREIRIIAETIASGLKFVADSDARAVGTAHPDGNLWDNGADAIEELEHLLKVRDFALRRFSDATSDQGGRWRQSRKSLSRCICCIDSRFRRLAS